MMLTLECIQKALNESLNEDMNQENLMLTGTISLEGIKKLNNLINADIHEDLLVETLDEKASLDYHYERHVLKKDEKRTSKNITKYNYMTPEDYYNHAITVSRLKPQIVITKKITDVAHITDLVEAFIFDTATSMLFDYDLKNNANKQSMIAIFNKNREYPNLYEICLVDKSSKQPITIFLLKRMRILRYFRDFLDIYQGNDTK